MKSKILAIVQYEPSWQYYIKFRKYLQELNHPFSDLIEYYVDTDMSITEDKLKEYPVVAFFHHDPLKRLYPEVYNYAKQIEEICLRNNIRLINSPDALSNSIKSVQLSILKSHGFNVASSVQFKNISELEKIDFYPIFIRADAGHDSENETMDGPFESFQELQNYSGEKIHERLHFGDDKVAIQFIDIQDDDLLYRRYRVFVAGGEVVTGNLHTSHHWYIHGVNNIENESTRKKSLEFVAKEYSNEEKIFFNKVNEALDLEFSAIDFSYEKDGRIVIWEANPHPAFPLWTENEPTKSRVTDLIARHYRQILDSVVNSN